MAKRSPPQQPASAHLSPDQKRQGIVKLQRRIADLESFDVSQIRERWNNPAVDAIQTSIDETLAKIFGHGTVEYRRYQSAARLDHGSLMMNHHYGAAESQQIIHDGIVASLALLRQAIKGFEEDLADEADAPPVGELAATPVSSDRIFVVHGHDEGARETVARIISKAGLTPIILHEQASGGRTIIEKLEHYSDVGFAVVILTPDDVGGAKDSAVQMPRARQNVIAELFYFIGKLTRARVCALKKGEIEEPSDIGGVVYVSMDDRGAWKSELLRELANAGYTVNWAGALG